MRDSHSTVSRCDDAVCSSGVDDELTIELLRLTLAANIDVDHRVMQHGRRLTALSLPLLVIRDGRQGPTAVRGPMSYRELAAGEVIMKL